MILRLVAVLLLAACAAPQMDEVPEPLGDFRLGYNIVQANDVAKGPFSRDASEAELTRALSEAIEARLGRYDGDGLYHIGIAVGAYVLAQPGLPVVYTPKSVLMFDVNVYDNATEQRLNDEPHRITAFEGLHNVAPVVGSGIARGKEAQLENLAAEGARVLEAWLRENPGWFTSEPGASRIEIDRAALRRRSVEAIAGAGAGLN